MTKSAHSGSRPCGTQTRSTPEGRILSVSGSPRKGGNSDRLSARILAAAEDSGVPGVSVRLADYLFQPCIGCERCRKDHICTGLHDGMHLLYPHVERCRGLVLISPVHHYNVTAWMKAFIDRLYCYYDFGDERPGEWSNRLAGQGRKAAVVSVGEQHGSEGIGLTLEAMRLPLKALGYEVAAELSVTGVFRHGGVSDRPDAMEQAGNVGLRLCEALKGEPHG